MKIIKTPTAKHFSDLSSGDCFITFNSSNLYIKISVYDAYSKYNALNLNTNYLAYFLEEDRIIPKKSHIIVED